MKNLSIIILIGLSLLTTTNEIISRDGCARGWRKDGMGRCHIDTKKDKAHDTAVEISENDAKIATYIEQSFMDQFATLAGAGIANITNLQIPTISPSIIPFISNDQLAQFTTGQIPLFTTAQVAALQPGQVAALTIAQATSLTQPQVQAFLSTQVAALPKDLLNITLPKLLPAQIPALTKVQIQGLSSTQLGSQIANLALHQMEFITVPQLQGFAPSAVSLISEDQINNMTAEQLKAFKVMLQASASTNPNVVMQINAVALAPGKGFTGDDAPPAKAPKHFQNEDLHKLNSQTRSNLAKSNRNFRRAFGFK